MRFEITSITITADNGGRPVEFSGSVWSGYPIYNGKNVKLRLPETKTELEKYFDNKVAEIKDFMQGKSTENDDW